MVDDDAARRAQLNDELGFYPVSLDEDSVAEYRRRAAAQDDGTAVTSFSAAPRGRTAMTEDEEIEARKKKAERGWLVEPERPRIGFSPSEEIEKWYAVIGGAGECQWTALTRTRPSPCSARLSPVPDRNNR